MSRPGRLAVLITAAVFACAALYVSTSAHHPLSSRVASLPVQSAAATVPRTPAAEVCTGVRGCRVVAAVDVDGDGRRDQVGVIGRKPADGGSITVRVRTATGHVLQTTGHDVYWFGEPFLGAVPLDGAAGAEIVVGSTMGANYEEFRVVTYRDGRLVTLDAPPAVWTKAGLAKSTPRWGIDGSYSFNSGVYRRVSADGVVTLTLKTADRNRSGHGFRGHTTTYRWTAGRWSKASSRTTHYPDDRSVQHLGGWHVPGLPAFVT
jgi:hypothetical protein